MIDLENDLAALRTKGYTDEEIDIWEAGYSRGRDSVVFEPHSAYRDKIKEWICEGDFDFVSIIGEVEYEGETYADLSEDGIDRLVSYFIEVMQMVDEQRSEAAGFHYSKLTGSGEVGNDTTN